MNKICMSCKSYSGNMERICKDGHFDQPDANKTPSCLRDDFSDDIWPFWLDDSGKPKNLRAWRKK